MLCMENRDRKSRKDEVVQFDISQAAFQRLREETAHKSDSET